MKQVLKLVQSPLGGLAALAASLLLTSSVYAVEPTVLETSLLKHGWEEYASDYEVPAPAELKSLATFPMDGVRLRDRSSGQTELRYTLPQELTGRSVEIRLLGVMDAKGSGTLTGEYSKADCVTGVCTLNYPKLQIDPTEVKAFLVSKGIGGAELDSRLEVAHLFRSGDPAGILRFKGTYP